MANFDEIFEEIKYSDKAENSLKDFSNWILGIAVGICVMLIFQFKEPDLTKTNFTKILYQITVIFSIINTFIVGFNKYLILRRDISMGIKYSLMKKMSVLSKVRDALSENEIKLEKEKMKNLFEEWSIEYNKIKRIGIIFNITIITTLVTVLMTGILIISTI